MVSLGAALGVGAHAQDSDDGTFAYDEAVVCAGKFRWVLEASSGGQPVLNEYSLDERVSGGEVWATRAIELAAELSSAPDVIAEIQAVSDDTVGAFFDDPDVVEAELMACAIGIGMREE